jgi:hypothetical protein
MQNGIIGMNAALTRTAFFLKTILTTTNRGRKNRRKQRRSEMEKKWTPGPWKVLNDQIKTPAGITLRVSGVALPCGYVPQEDESYANAHLIAAAPELYEALEEIFFDGQDYAQRSGKYVSWLKKAEAALIKARGETGERGE